MTFMVFSDLTYVWKMTFPLNVLNFRRFHWDCSEILVINAVIYCKLRSIGCVLSDSSVLRNRYLNKCEMPFVLFRTTPWLLEYNDSILGFRGIESIAKRNEFWLYLLLLLFGHKRRIYCGLWLHLSFQSSGTQILTQLCWKCTRLTTSYYSIHRRHEFLFEY